MSNLIPPYARQAIKKEYWIRVLSVWVILIATGLLITALLLLPAYVLIESQKKAYATAYSEASVQSSEFADITDVINNTNALTRELLLQVETTSIVSYITVVNNALSTDTQLSYFSYDQKQQVIAIRGIATDRQALAALKTRLEATNKFKRIELPIGSLAGNQNISFSMQLVLKETEL